MSMTMFAARVRRASLAAAVLLLRAGFAAALDAEINVRLPYNIAYELKPIEIGIALKGPNPGGAVWRVCDVFGEELASGKLEGASAAVSFAPPRWGWYMVACQGPDRRGVAKFLGVTPKFPGVHTLAEGELAGGWNDSALIAFAGLGLDRTNTRHKGIDGLAETLARSEKFGVPLLVQFEGKEHCRPDHVREAVTKYRGRVKYWEVMNEPNFSMSPEQYAELVKQLVPIIKGADPAAKVMGPDTCGIDLGWHERLYKAGGGRLLDAISIHDYEGDEAVDPFHWLWKLGELRKLMARYGDGAKEIWQTERAIGAVRAKLFLGATQAIRITLQRDLLELFGVTNDRNSHYYANVTGYNDVPTFVYSESGPHPAALVCRTRAAMIAGRRFARRLEFGPTGDKLLLGLLYEGPDGSTVTLRNLGCRDLPVEFRVTGASQLEVVDSFGNSEKLPVRGGKAVVTASELPVYLRLARGQAVSPPRIDFGRNIAQEARFSYSGGAKGSWSLVTDGIFQVFHHGYPWPQVWAGGYTGRVFDESPQTLEISFDGPREIGALLLFSARADNPHCALLDYDLQRREGGGWVTVEEVRTPCPESDPVKTYLCEAATWYRDSNFFVHRFARPLKTDGLRLVVRRLTRGFAPDMTAERALGRDISAKALEIREIELYGPSQVEGLVDARAEAGATPSAPAATRRHGAPSPEALAAFDALLRARLAEELRAGRNPSFFLSRTRTQVRLLELAGPEALRVLAREPQAELSLPWSDLSADEKKHLALSVLREGNRSDHKLAAFYLLAAGEMREAERHLSAAGELADAVRTAFP